MQACTSFIFNCLLGYFAFAIIFLNCVKNIIVVTAAAIMSLTGSATNTPNTLSVKKFGKMKISGISKISFLRNAIIKLIAACPRAMKLC